MGFGTHSDNDYRAIEALCENVLRPDSKEDNNEMINLCRIVLGKSMLDYKDHSKRKANNKKANE